MKTSHQPSALSRDMKSRGSNPDFRLMAEAERFGLSIVNRHSAIVN
jgi:hypothetical protein